MLISWKKVLCSVLAFVFILSLFPMTFSAEETVPDAPAESTVSEEPEKVDLKKQIVDESEVPDLIDYSVVVEKKYVKRSYERESSLNEVVFLRADGAFDRYTFSFPVKYEANGEILDKNPELTIHETLLDGKYRFASTEHNDLSVLIPYPTERSL